MINILATLKNTFISLVISIEFLVILATIILLLYRPYELKVVNNIRVDSEFAKWVTGTLAALLAFSIFRSNSIFNPAEPKDAILHKYPEYWKIKHTTYVAIFYTITPLLSWLYFAQLSTNKDAYTINIMLFTCISISSFSCWSIILASNMIAEIINQSEPDE